MKKMLTVIIALLLTLASVPAFAAGKLRVEQENFIVTDNYGLYCYAYAKVKNVGDKPIKVNAGVLEVFDAEGDPITSSDYLSAYAEYLQPDEYTYVSMYSTITGYEAEDVDDYLLTITGKSEKDYLSYRLPVTTEYKEDVDRGYYNTEDYMYATITNDTAEPIFGITAVLVLLDAEGNILYVDDAGMYSDKGIMPGSSIIVRLAVSSSFIDAYEKNGSTPASVDAIAYVNVRQ